MPDAFTAAGLDDPRGPKQLTATPQSTVSAEAIAGPFEQVARAVGYVGQRIDEATVDLQSQAGREAAATVSRRPDGSPDVSGALRPFALSAGDRAYNAALMQGALASGTAKVDEIYGAMHAQHLGDPAGFKAASDAYIQKLGSTGDPALRPLLVQQAQQVAVQRLNNLADTKAKLDVSRTRDGILSTVQTLQNDLNTLALRDGVGTPEFIDASNKLKDAYNSLAANPLYRYSHETVDAELKKSEGQARYFAVTGMIDQVLKAGGEKAVYETIQKKILDDPNSPVPYAERVTMAGYAEARLSFLRGERRKDIATAQRTTSAILEAWDKNAAYPDLKVDEHLERLKQLGADEQVADIVNRRVWQQKRVALTDNSDGARSSAGAPPVAASGMAGGNTVVFGDSNGVALGPAARALTYARNGANTDDVLSLMQGAGASSIRDRDVVIFPGASNDVAGAEKVREQVSYAKTNGARSVTVVGVGDRADMVSGNVNARLAKALEGTDARVVDIGPTRDGIHSSDFPALWQRISGGASLSGSTPAQPGSPAQPGAPAPSTAQASPQVIAAIQGAAQKYGVSEALLNRIAFVESRFDPNAANPSGATGLFQFVPGTWAQYGQGQNPRDPAANADAAARLLVDNRNSLRTALGREPTDGEIYLAHQQGAGGAAKLLSNPGARAIDVVGRGAVLQNGGTEGMTAGQFAQLWVGKFDRGPGVNVVPGGSYTAPPSTTMARPATGGYTIPPAPYTPEQIAANPDLQASWIRAAIGDRDSQVKAAGHVADAIIAGLGTYSPDQLPNPRNLGYVLEVAQRFGDAGLGKKADTITSGLRSYDLWVQSQGGTAGEGRNREADARQLASTGNLAAQAILRDFEKWKSAGVTRFNEDPLGEGPGRYWFPAIPALDVTSPSTIGAGVAARASAASIVAAHNNGVTPSLLMKDDAHGLVPMLMQAGPPAISAFVTSVLHAPAEVVTATLNDTRFTGALKTLALTTDPATYSATMSGLSAIKNGVNVQRFADAFGQDTLKDVQGFEVSGRTRTDEDLKRWLQTRQDPSSLETIKGWQRDAENKAAELAPKALGQLIAKSAPNQPWGSSFDDRAPEDPEASAAMLGDYRAMVREAVVQPVATSTRR